MTTSLRGRDVRIPSRELLYCLGLMLVTFSLIVEQSTIPHSIDETFSTPVLKAIRYASYLIVAVSLLLRPAYSRRSLILIAAVMGIAVIDARRAGFGLLLPLLFAVGMIGLDYRRVAKAQFIAMAFTFAFIVVGSQIGLVDNWGFELTTSRPRYCLGFFYPSHMTSVFFYLVLLFCFLKGRDLRIWHVIVIAALDFWQYHYTDSRAGTALALLAAVVMFLLRNRPVPRKWLSVLLSFSFVICAAVCLAVTWCHIKGVVDLSQLNRLLANRLDLQRDILTTHHVGLFGQRMEWIGYGGTGYTQQAVGDNYNFIDCAYLKVLLEQGILMWSLVLAGFTFAGLRAAKRGDFPLLLALAFSAVYCMVEQWLINPGFHPFFILIGALFLLGEQEGDKPIRFGAPAGGAAA